MSTAENSRPALFDRIFKPEHIILENGHTIDRPKSRMPLILTVLVIVVWISVVATGFNFHTIIDRRNQLTVILSQIFQPKWSYLDKVWKPLIETIKMSLMGTVIGCLLGLPMAIFASTNIN